MAADILGQRVERNVGPVLERPLEDRAQQGVVASDDRREPLALRRCVGDAADQRDVDQGVEGVRGRLDHDDRDTARAWHSAAARTAFSSAVREADRVHPEAGQRLAISVSVPP